MSLALLALLVAATPGAPLSSVTVPAALTNPAPATALNWRSLDLEAGRAGVSPKVASEGDAGRFQIEVRGSVIRLAGSFGARCEPVVSQWIGNETSGVEVPLAVAPAGADRIVSLPPDLAVMAGPEGDAPPVFLRVALARTCDSRALRAFAAVLTPDDYALTQLALNLRPLVGTPRAPDDVKRWLAAPFPHRWQQSAALAVVLPALLGAPDDGATRALAAGWLEEALAEARADDATFARLRPVLTGDRAKVSIPGDDALVLLLPEAALDVDVAGEEALRLFHRLPDQFGNLEGLRAPRDGVGAAGRMRGRIAVAFDGATPITVPVLAGQDPAAPGWSRLRTTFVAVPAGARRARVTALGGAVALRGSTIWHKPHLEDLLSHRDATAWLAEAARGLDSAQAHSRLAAQLAQIARGDARTPALATLLASADPLVAALAALLAAEHATDPAVATALIERADRSLEKIATPATRAAIPLLQARLSRLRQRLALASGNPLAASAALEKIVAAPVVCDEDAVAFAVADALSPGTPGRGARAQALLDGLLARRPLDHGLRVERARLLALATRWHALPAPPGVDQIAFLDRAQGEATPGRDGFVPLPTAGGSTAVDVPPALLARRQPTLSLVAARGDGLGAAATVRIDGVRAATLPVLLPLERFELPINPGRHQVTIDPGNFGGQLFGNFSTADAWFRFRRYAAVAPEGAAWAWPEIGSPGLVKLSFRAVIAADPASARPPGETIEAIAVEVRGLGQHSITLRLRPGQARSGDAADLPPGSLVTTPIELALPTLGQSAQLVIAARPGRGVRLFAHVAIRKKRQTEGEAMASQDPLLVDAAGALSRTGDVWQAVTDLSARLGRDQPDPASIHLARAQILAELDEPALAREDLLAALADHALGPHQLALVEAIWGRLDDLGGGPLASVPSGAPSPSVALALMPPDEVLAAGTRGLLDDARALATAPATQLRQRAGRAGDLIVLHAARLAETQGDATRAMQLWQDLTEARPGIAAVRREAGAALLRLGDHPGAAARAYLDLWAATRIDPRDTEARRLLRHAGAATRLRPLRLPEDSAGTESLHLASDGSDAEIEPKLLPPAPGASATTLITGDRPAALSFRLPAPMRLSLHADAIDLRPGLARATGALPLALLVERGGQPRDLGGCKPQPGSRLRCDLRPFDLPAGPHTLNVRLSGGARPAARLAVGLARTASRSRRGASARAASATIATDLGISAEHLLARPEAPVRLHLRGPALVRIEARTALPGSPREHPRRETTTVQVRARAGGLPPLEVELHPPVVTDPWAARSSGDQVSPAVADFVALERDALYLLEVRPATGTAFIRLAVRDGNTEAERPPERLPAPLSYRVDGTPMPSPPPALDQAPIFVIEDGVVPPGAAQFGSVAVGFGLARRLRNAEGATVQTSTAAVTTLAWRRLFEDAHVTAKTALEMRTRAEGRPAQWLDADLFYLDPARRWLRLLVSADLVTQPVGSTRAWTGELAGMVEPVTTLLPGLHLVGKLGAWTSRRTLADPDPALLPEIDPDVYNRFSVAHPRGLFLESGLEIEPLANLVIYGNARLTSNPSFSPFDQDHVSAALIARALFGRIAAEAAARTSWFFVDRDRPDPVAVRSLFFSVFHTLWFTGRQRGEIGLWTGVHLDRRATELSLYVAWEGSNGRGFRDHTPLEGENYFFAQRGPTGGGGHLCVVGPP